MLIKHLILINVLVALIIFAIGQTKDTGIPEIHNFKNLKYKAASQN